MLGSCPDLLPTAFASGFDIVFVYYNETRSLLIGVGVKLTHLGTALNLCMTQKAPRAPAENQNLFEQNHQGKITLTRTVNKMPQVARPVATLI